MEGDLSNHLIGVAVTIAIKKDIYDDRGLHSFQDFGGALSLLGSSFSLLLATQISTRCPMATTFACSLTGQSVEM